MDISLLDVLTNALGHGQRVALAIVTSSLGSAPRKAGSAIVAGRGGRVAGTVGGGIVEAESLSAALRVIGGGGAELIRVRLLGKTAAGPEPICGGEVELLIFRVEDLSPFSVATRRLSEGHPAILVYDATDGATRNPFAALNEKGEVLWGPEWREGLVSSCVAKEIVQKGRAGRVGGSLFLDPILPAERLLVLGGGHIGKALSRIAAVAGFDVTIVDPRLEFSNPADAAPGVSVIRGGFEEAIARFAPRPTDYAVVVSSDHRGDLEAVRSLLAHELKYIGLLGSRRKITLAIGQLVSEGHDPSRVEGICAPVGLDIGAETPEEIAVAICAELIAYRRGGPCLSYLDEERRARRARPYV